MSTPSGAADAALDSPMGIHPDWDRDKVLSRVEFNAQELGQLRAVAEAFQEAAEESWRAFYRRERQDMAFRELVSKPRGGVS